ncbi:Uncharacterised protein [Mycobacteroides abscessus subsp. abscessus]|nr:Uncharacterised protein [Mycobacteroides abscessus subsp. abscessus]
MSMYCAGCPVTFSNARASSLYGMWSIATSRSMPLDRSVLSKSHLT